MLSQRGGILFFYPFFMCPRHILSFFSRHCPSMHAQQPDSADASHSRSAESVIQTAYSHQIISAVSMAVFIISSIFS